MYRLKLKKAEKNLFSGNEVLNNLKIDENKIDDEFTKYREHIDEINQQKSMRNTNQSMIIPENIKKKKFNEVFSNNYSLLNYKTRPKIKVKIVKEIGKFDK